MPVGGSAARFAAQLKCSNILQRQLSQISWEAVAKLDGDKGTAFLCTEPVFDALHGAEAFKVSDNDARCLVQDIHAMAHSFGTSTAATAVADRLCAIKVVDPFPKSDDRAGWVGYDLCFEGGARDRLVLRPKAHVPQEMLPVLLQAIWPVLREDLMAEEQARDRPPTEQALLWTIATKTDSAVMVLDLNGKLLDCNEAGREYLDSGKLFRTNAKGLLRCNQDLETRSVNEAIRRCVATDGTVAPGGDTEQAGVTGDTGGGTGATDATEECLLFLREQDGEQALPVSFTRYQAAEGAEPMVVVILPRQPHRSRIELVAQKMGLSPTEARVAALLQLGLTNREAASIAGVKEQTFNTYAKRVLSKMNVGSRSQVAQRLTWQAAWGRMV